MFTPLIVVAIAAAALFIWWRLSKRTKITTETPVTPVEQPVETAPVAQLLPPETITYSYDNTGKLVGAAFSGTGQAILWEYDEVGNRDRNIIS